MTLFKIDVRLNETLKQLLD